MSRSNVLPCRIAARIVAWPFETRMLPTPPAAPAERPTLMRRLRTALTTRYVRDDQDDDMAVW